ncbi:hypothetical protein COCOBI_16-3570 [Coccomyxa sp. Obi]|nr:hypothetical protein COCOBI_16-3570 [Coccomyxa sp. Obi]
MDRITVSQLRAEFAGGEKELRDRQPFVMFQISRSRFQTEPITDSGKTAAWPGTYSASGFTYDDSRELFAAVYDHSAAAEQTLIGMGAQKLDASTGTRGSISLADCKHTIGELKYHLDTHDYDFSRPVYGPWGSQIENPHDRVIDIGQHG